MDEKVHLTSDPVIDSHYDDDSWQRYAVESDVKREWDNLLANNLEEYELPLSSRPTKRSSGELEKMFSGLWLIEYLVIVLRRFCLFSIKRPDCGP